MRFKVEVEFDDVRHGYDEYDQNSEAAQVLEALAWTLGVDMERDVAVVDADGNKVGRAWFTTDDPVSIMAAVLKQHGEVYDSDCDTYSGCECGWDNGTGEHNTGYAEHVAHALNEALVGTT